MNYYQHHIGDYLVEAAHLSFVEDAAYSRLIRLYYGREQPFPADVVKVIRLSGARSKAEKAAVQTVLQEFFLLQEDGWHNQRLDEDIERYQKSHSSKKAAADARWGYGKNSEENAASAVTGEAKKTAADARRYADKQAIEAVRNGKHESLHVQNECTNESLHVQNECTNESLHVQKHDCAMLTNNHKPITNNHKPITNNHKPITIKSIASGSQANPPASAMQDGETDTCEKPDKPKPKVSDAAKHLRERTWQRYETAFVERNHHKPIRNKSVNCKIAALCERLGQDAPDVAAHYLTLNDAWLVKNKHPVGMLLQGAEGYYSQWVSGENLTMAQARQVENTQTNLNTAFEASREFEDFKNNPYLFQPKNQNPPAPGALQ